MLGRRNIRDSIGYVTLGLFTHALLNELLEAKGKPAYAPTRTEMITLAIDSLKAIESPAQFEPSRKTELVFQNYQEVTTLRKMFDTQKILEGQDTVKSLRSLQGVLNKIISTDIEAIERLGYLSKAIEFFSNLARKAVINAEYPEEKVPPGVRLLVR